MPNKKAKARKSLRKKRHSEIRKQRRKIKLLKKQKRGLEIT